MKVTLFLLLFLSASFVAKAERIKVKFECSCDDPVGASYATALRDLLATSPRYIETPYESEPKSSESSDKVYHFEIRVVSVDIEDPAPKGRESALSIVFVVNGLLIGQHVQTCGSSVVAQCAATTLASLDKSLH